jgi:hypothetical protein
MSLVLRYGSAAFGIRRRDAAVFVSDRLRFVAQIASTLFTLLLFYDISKLDRVQVELLRDLLVGTPLDSSASAEVGKLALFAAVLIPASVWVRHQAVRVGRRRVTITEY